MQCLQTHLVLLSFLFSKGDLDRIVSLNGSESVQNAAGIVAGSRCMEGCATNRQRFAQLPAGTTDVHFSNFIHKFFSLCFYSARVALRSRLLLWLCKPAEGVERSPDLTLPSPNGTLKQIALVNKPASRTRFRMALSLHTLISFAAAEGG
ncbi:hypothetical protein TRVL_10044 [Trypanosoma vivax]|nr:hypothetical protein TRVL_10044 [Trypanosoma vivax]